MTTQADGDWASCDDPYSDADGEFCWEGLEDPDRFLPPDPLDREEPVRCEAQLSSESGLCSESGRYASRPPDCPDDDPPELTPDEFAAEIRDGGTDAAASLLGSLEPGPQTAALLALLKPSSLSPASMVSVVVATERLASWVQARQHRWLAAFACPDVVAPARALREYASQPGQPLHPKRPMKANGSDRQAVPGSQQDADLSCSGSGTYGDPDVHTVLNETTVKVAAAEIGAALHFSPISAQRRVCQAVDFAVDLPATLTALEKGSIDRARSMTIAERTLNLPVTLRRRVEEDVLPKATTRTPGQLRGIVDRAVLSVDPLAAKKRHEKAVAERNVTYRAAEDGMGIFRAELRADKARLAYSVIDQIAYQLNRNPRDVSDTRGVGALRSDAFSDLFDQLATTGTVTLRSTLNRGANGEPKTCNAEPPLPDPTDRPDLTDLHCQREQARTTDESSSSGGTNIPDESSSFENAMPDESSRFGGAGSVGGATTGEQSRDRHDGGVTGHGQHDDRDSTCQADAPEPSAESFWTRCGAGSPRGTGLGTHQGRLTHLNVTVAASTLAGLDDLPGDLDGHGPIPADLARAIAASASTINAVALNSGCGTALDLGRTTYRPRLAQRDLVTTRDQTCRFPGCRQPARRCQIDHSDEYCPGRKNGGVTCPCNLTCLCVFHHGLKTGGLWDSVQQPDASIVWTSPTGRIYTTHPREWPTDDNDPSLASDPENAVAKDIPAEQPPEAEDGQQAAAGTTTAGSSMEEFIIAETALDRSAAAEDDEPPF